MNSELVMIETSLALLRQYKKIHQFSFIMSFVALVLLLSPVLGVSFSGISLWFLLLALIFGVLQTYISVRIGFDRELLENIFSQYQYSPEFLKHLDNALIKLCLVPENKVNKTLHERLLACNKLFKTQVVVSLFQFAVLLIVVFISGF